MVRPDRAGFCPDHEVLELHTMSLRSPDDAQQASFLLSEYVKKRAFDEGALKSLLWLLLTGASELGQTAFAILSSQCGKERDAGRSDYMTPPGESITAISLMALLAEDDFEIAIESRSQQYLQILLAQAGSRPVERCLAVALDSPFVVAERAVGILASLGGRPDARQALVSVLESERVSESLRFLAGIYLTRHDVAEGIAHLKCVIPDLWPQTAASNAVGIILTGDTDGYALLEDAFRRGADKMQLIDKMRREIARTGGAKGDRLQAIIDRLTAAGESL